MPHRRGEFSGRSGLERVLMTEPDKGSVVDLLKKKETGGVGCRSRAGISSVARFAALTSM